MIDYMTREDQFNNNTLNNIENEYCFIRIKEKNQYILHLSRDAGLNT